MTDVIEDAIPKPSPRRWLKVIVGLFLGALAIILVFAINHLLKDPDPHQPPPSEVKKDPTKNTGLDKTPSREPTEDAPVTIVDGKRYRWMLQKLIPDWAAAKEYRLQIAASALGLYPDTVKNAPLPLFVLPACGELVDGRCKGEFLAQKVTIDEGGFSIAYKSGVNTILQYAPLYQYTIPPEVAGKGQPSSREVADDFSYAVLENGNKIVVTKFGIPYQFFITCGAPTCISGESARRLAVGGEPPASAVRKAAGRKSTAGRRVDCDVAYQEA